MCQSDMPVSENSLPFISHQRECPCLPSRLNICFFFLLLFFRFFFDIVELVFNVCVNTGKVSKMQVPFMVLFFVFVFRRKGGSTDLIK